MDLNFKITQKDGTNMSSLVKQMCKLRCRIKVDAQQGEISIEGMDDNSVENVIDSVDASFNIVGVDIVPTVGFPETQELVETTETIETQEPVVTAESLEIEKIEFSNKEVEERINKLLRVIYWTMYNNQADSGEMCKYLTSVTSEIAMKYNPHELVEFSVGDIVMCNYGKNLSGEISGGHVHAVVCDIEKDGVFYAAPITKEKKKEDKLRYLPFEADLDVDYVSSEYTGGGVLLKKGGYIRAERVWEVVGKARPEFFKKLLSLLPDTVDFSYDDYEDKMSEKHKDVHDNVIKLLKEVDESEEFLDEAVNSNFGDNITETSIEGKYDKAVEEYPTSSSSSEDMKEGQPSNDNEKTSAEDFLAAFFASSLESLDTSKTIGENIDMFLNSIGFQSNEIIRTSFRATLSVKKVCYESIIFEIRKFYPTVKEEIIKATMKNEFNKWLNMHPKIKEKCPRVSFTALLKVFAKKMR